MIGFRVTRFAFCNFAPIRVWSDLGIERIVGIDSLWFLGGFKVLGCGVSRDL